MEAKRDSSVRKVANFVTALGIIAMAVTIAIGMYQRRQYRLEVERYRDAAVTITVLKEACEPGLKPLAATVRGFGNVPVYVGDALNDTTCNLTVELP